MLASMSPPFNHFEVAELRDLVLGEIHAPTLSKTEALVTYSASLLQAMLDGSKDMAEVVATISDLCVNNDYLEELHDFYLLECAYMSLQSSTTQYYWPLATRENIKEIIFNEAKAFIDRFKV